MRIEIKKIEKVIKLNEGRLRGITNDVEPESTPAKELYRLIHCFMGDLYKLFGNEYLRDTRDPTLSFPVKSSEDLELLTSFFEKLGEIFADFVADLRERYDAKDTLKKIDRGGD